MITQSLQNLSHTEVIGVFHTMIDRLNRYLAEQIDTHKKIQSQRARYNYYQKLSINQLHDIGLGNPHEQLRMLGRYLDASALDPCNLRTQDPNGTDD